jgi:uncharacterized RDD family membrane protein YckC
MGDAFNPYEPPRADAGRDADPFVPSINDVPQASRGVRLANLVLDSICRSVIGAILGFIASMAKSPLLAIGLSLVSMVCYYLLFEGLFQATPGKFITRTRVVDLDGNKPTFTQILGRTLTRFVPFEPLSFFSSTQDGWHDRWSGTRVVQR